MDNFRIEYFIKGDGKKITGNVFIYNENEPNPKQCVDIVKKIFPNNIYDICIVTIIDIEKFIIHNNPLK